MNKILWLRNDISGFTLVEVLLSMTVMAVGMLGLASLQAAAIKGNLAGKKTSIATALIEQKIEQIKAMGYDNIVTANLSNETGLNQTGTNAPAGPFSRTTTVQTDTPATGMKTIQVTVSWTDVRTHSIVLQTIVAP